MKCSKCGTELENNVLVCPFCGQVMSEEERAAQEQQAGRQITKQEFINLPAMKPCKSNIITCGILLYVLGVINAVLQVVGGIFPVDGFILVLLGLGIHLGKSRICSILCIVYSAFNVIYMTVMTGRVTGWWILIIAIYATIYTFKYHAAWNKYQKDGILPAEKEKK